MKKQILSLLLCCCLLITVLPITASAEGETPTGGTITRPSIKDVIGHIGSSASDAYDASLNFWNDYGNNISGGFSQAGERWNIIKNTPDFASEYGDAVKVGDGIFTVAGAATNVMDSVSAAHQLTHPQDNPYAAHPALSTAYDTLTAWQTMMNWAEMAVGDKDPTGGGEAYELSAGGGGEGMVKYRHAGGFAGLRRSQHTGGNPQYYRTEC